MPGGFPLGLELCAGTDQGTDTSTSGGTAVTGGSGTANGSYTQLVASSAQDACAILVPLRKDTTSFVNPGAVSIAVGAAASEQDILTDFPLYFPGGTSGTINFLLPIQIPAGSRISARARGGDTYNVQVTLFDGAFTMMEGGAGADPLGFTTGTADFGTSVAASGSTNTKGSYSQVVASTTMDYIGFLFTLYDSNNTGQVGNAGRYLFDIAIGAGGSEVPIVPNLPVVDNTGNTGIHSLFFPIPIPSGTRIAVRCQCATASKTFSTVLHGVYQ